MILLKQWLRPKRIVLLLTVVLLLSVLLYLPLPLTKTSPSEAENLQDRVTVPGAVKNAKGAFLFTSVYVQSDISPLDYLISLFETGTEIQSTEKAVGAISNLEAYDQLLGWMEQDAEAGAIISAYHHLNKPIQIERYGVMIQAIQPDSSIASSFYEGDMIVAVNGQPVKTLDELRLSIADKKPGDSIKIAAMRGQEKVEANVVLTKVINDSGAETPGLGIRGADAKKPIITDKIQMQFSDIGGNSAGLMLTLELLSQLSGTDYSRGYIVAGTGTIDAEGKVGQVGGVKFKVIGADQVHADYFFVPKDIGPNDSNEATAKQTVASIGTSMKVVPVGSLDEAVAFLQKLPEKK